MMSDIRTKSSKILSEALGDERLGSAVESALFAQCGGETHNDYRASIRSKLLNLKENPLLVKNLTSGKLSAADFAAMGAEEMASTKRRLGDEQLEEENTRQAIAVDTHEPHTADQDMPFGESHDNRAGQEGIEFEHA